MHQRIICNARLCKKKSKRHHSPHHKASYFESCLRCWSNVFLISANHISKDRAWMHCLHLCYSQRHRLLARSNFTFTTPCLNLTHPPSPSKIVHCKIFPFQRQHWKAWKIKIHEMYTVQEIMSDWFTAYILGKCRSGELQRARHSTHFLASALHFIYFCQCTQESQTPTAGISK